MSKLLGGCTVLVLGIQCNSECNSTFSLVEDCKPSIPNLLFHSVFETGMQAFETMILLPDVLPVYQMCLFHIDGGLQSPPRSCELDLVKVTIEAEDGPKMCQTEPWRWIETSTFHQVELYLLCDPGGKALVIVGIDDKL